MDVFGENLQFYRKQKSMTQEQLAEQLEVSRQTVSKWEAGASYPEMEKILQLCDTFSCDMDTLLRKDAAVLETADSQGYARHMEKRRRYITFGVAFLILGVAMTQILEGFQKPEQVSNMVFLSMAIVSVLVFTVAGLEHSVYQKNHPFIPDFYTAKEKAEFEEKFPRRVASGIGLILIGLLIGMNGEDLPLREGMQEEFYYGVFLLFASIGVGVTVYVGLGKEKYEVDAYNRENSPNKLEANKAVGIWCGCIMLLATILFFVAGVVFRLWQVCWVVFPVGGLFCGIAALVLSAKKG